MSVFRFAGATAILAASAVGFNALAAPPTGLIRPGTKPGSGAAKAKRVAARALGRQIGVQSASPKIPTAKDGNITPHEIEISTASEGNIYPRDLKLNSTDFPLTSTLAQALGLGPVVPAPILNLPQNTASDVDWILSMNKRPEYNDPNNPEIPSVDTNIAYGVMTADDVAAGLGTFVTGVKYAGSASMPRGKYGYWRGNRIVDAAGNDEGKTVNAQGDKIGDIFVQGGKVNDVSSWHVEASSVGSPKYDITQAFLANTTNAAAKNMLFFGMERRGNNGTTEFEFEFNAKPPALTVKDKTGIVTLAVPVLDSNGQPTFDENGNPIVIVKDSRYGYIPDRSEGDPLFAFEMNGSGSSGGITSYVFLWSIADSKFLLLKDYLLKHPELPKGDAPISTINAVDTPGEPWGFVNSKGDWQIGMIPQWQLAKAAAYFGDGQPVLPKLAACGGRAFVQVRSRASVTDSSDLKDTTKIFAYVFGGPSAKSKVDSPCPVTTDAIDGIFTFDGKDSKSTPPGQPLKYQWTFTYPAGIELKGNGFTPPASGGTITFDDATARTVKVDLKGQSGAQIDLQLTVLQGPTCKDTTAKQSFTIYPRVTATADLKADCDSRKLTFEGAGGGGKGPLSLEWNVFKEGKSDPVYTLKNATKGSFTPTEDGVYSAVLSVKDSRFDPNDTTRCAVMADKKIYVADAINPKAAKDKAADDGGSVDGHVDFHAIDAAYGKHTVQWQKSLDGGKTWQDIGTFTDAKFTYSAFETDDQNPAKKVLFTIGTDNYVGKVYTVLLRAVVTRTFTDGRSCSKETDPITVKKVIGADP